MSRYQKGKSGNPNGRPLGKRNKSTEEIKQLLDNEVEFAEVVKKLFSMAKRGNVRAAELLLAYRFGKAKTMEISSIETDEKIPLSPSEARKELNEILRKNSLALVESSE